SRTELLASLNCEKRVSDGRSEAIDTKIPNTNETSPSSSRAEMIAARRRRLRRGLGGGDGAGGMSGAIVALMVAGAAGPIRAARRVRTRRRRRARRTQRYPPGAARV